ncbi:MAG: exodeoxyribonuclease III [Melioribacteraceae bacterium]|nr:exodeoxyribonuclease III [Melioribacteraceae bacterium]MCF8353591.1 exodeoxyribonuclease III [Melioribacteraceae bacterium]MCF8393514.1 exodeoxyribonuclease III [Melioribacteraceae bacterium]MCF8419324.1 exodeoxyribonuclease III [Melioribacteraceae bacterium]
MKKYRLLSWNVNGIRAVSKKGFLEWFEKEQPDILCLQETKAWKEQLNDELINVPGYKSYFAEAEKKGYSGVVIYTKEEPIKIQYGLGIPQFDSEGRTIIAEYKNFVLYNIYYPNGKRSKERLQYKMDFYEAFRKHAADLKSKGKKIIICGDVNTAHKEIDLARPKANEKTSGFLPEEREWMDKFFNEGFIDTLRMFTDAGELYTWWDMLTRARDRNVGWRIDYFFISDNLRKNITNAFIMQDVMGSDHCPVGIELKI